MLRPFHKTCLLFLIYLPNLIVFAQVTETKSWCNLTCEYTAADQQNAELIHLRMEDDSIKQLILSEDALRFPLRFAIVQKDTAKAAISELVLRRVIENLNVAFEPVGFVFYLSQIDLIISDLSIEELSANRYNKYDTFSAKNDVEDMITVYILDHSKDFCKTIGNSISCSRTGGFSYILSGRTNNLVISQFDLSDPKIVAHEFGHFFGLFHTFEEHVFGKDTFEPTDCSKKGDRICDTPPDPGTVYEIYVNYSTCEMVDFKDKNGNEYQPLLNNYMSYYKPCYLKAYSFTPEQILEMQLAGRLDIRRRFTR